MPLKSKSRDKGKDPQTKSESQKSQNTTKLDEGKIELILKIKIQLRA
jgi:hypothetical protein